MDARSSEQRFSCDDAMPSRAREWVRQALADILPASPAASRILDDAEIVVSELATNALRAHCGSSSVRWQVDGRAVTVSVRDDADGWPRQAAAAPTDQRGRGLLIVAALAQQWGVVPEERGKRTWAELVLT